MSGPESPQTNWTLITTLCVTERGFEHMVEMVGLLKLVSLLSYLALLSNALSDHDFLEGDKCQQQGADQNDLLVKVDTGCVEGTRLSGTRVFRGIPYASPPVGNLRWRPPQPHKPWDSTLNATGFRSTCFQTVYRPRGNKSLPVQGMWPSIQGVQNLSEVPFRPKQPPSPVHASLHKLIKLQTSCLLAGLLFAYFYIVLVCSFCLFD